MDVVDCELLRISENIQKQALQQANDPEDYGTTWKSKMKFIADPAFLKPLLLLLFIQAIGLEWTGFAAVRFYTVLIVRYFTYACKGKGNQI